MEETSKEEHMHQLSFALEIVVRQSDILKSTLSEIHKEQIQLKVY